MKLRDLHRKLGEILADTSAGHGDYAVCAVDRDAEPSDAYDVDMVAGAKVLSLYDEDTDSYIPMVGLLLE